MARTKAFAVSPFLLLATISKAWALVVHDRFIEEVVTSTKGMSGTFLPNPRNGNKPMMILNAKNGQINVLEDPDESPDSIEIMDLSEGPKVCNNGERGLHTVIPSPSFAENRHLFAFFTKYKEDCLEDPEEGPHNVVMRFTMDAETLMLDYDEGTLIFRGPPMDERVHNGGAMAFGNDGKLYITTGDAGKRHNAGTFDDVHGSIIRLNEDGTVPDDNPYTKASGYSNSYRCADTGGRVPNDAPEDSYCSEVWANGLRNPFRIDMDPNVKDKVKFSFGVVGAQHIEAIYYGGTDYKGTNYGWPKYEGVCKPGDIETCDPYDDDPSITMPFHWYEHISYEDGGCVGGQVHVPEGIWPPEFKYLFIDFILLEIYALEENRPDMACNECDPPLPPTRNETFYRSIRKDGDNINEARLVEMWFGPYKDTQALYVTKFGNHDTVIRIRYNGILNKPPKPAFDFEYDGEVTVEFDASGTVDPEGDELTYQWDFGDESAFALDQTVTSHQYAQPGEYDVTLIVTDTSGQEQQVTKTVKIGTVPKVKILHPPENTTFAVGQSLLLKGEAVDFLGNPIPDERLTWEVRQHHANHFHPFLDPTRANNFKLFAAPEPEDYLAATNSFLKVVLTAEDEYGLSETVSVDVQPNIIMVNVTTEPFGLDVVVDDYDIETPQIITSWKGFKLPVTVADQPPYIFKEWSDGRKARTRVFPIYQQPNDPIPQVRAIFCGDLGTNCESHGDCCSGYCSLGMNGMCAPMPITQSPTEMPPTSSPTSLRRPTYVVVQDPPASDLEINVVTPPYANENERQPLDLYPKNPIMDEDSSFPDNTSVSANLSENSNNGSDVQRQGGIDSITAWISALAIAVAFLVIGWFVARCSMYSKDKKPLKSTEHKLYHDDESQDGHEESDENMSKTGNDEYYYDGRGIKANGTGSTQESDDRYNADTKDSPLSRDVDTSNSDISLSFLIPESISSEPRYIDDVENQAPTADSYLLPPLSPASSMECAKEHNAEVEEVLEYRFDAASTSQSSLIPPPPSAALGQKSFDEGLQERSISLSISSPEQILPHATRGKKTGPTEKELEKTGLLNPPSVTEPSFSFLMPPPSLVEESFEERKLEETSEAIESLVLNYLSEKTSTQEVPKDDTSSSLSPQVPDKSDASLSPQIPDNSDMTDEEVQSKENVEVEVDEDARVLDLLLVDSSDIEDEFAKNQTEGSNISSPQTDSDRNEKNSVIPHEIFESDVGESFVPTPEASGSLQGTNEMNSVDPTKLTEDSSILSQICIASVSEENHETSRSSQFEIKTVIHENDDSGGETDLSPLKSPTLPPKRQRQTKTTNFMSPEVNRPLKTEIETPGTLAMSYDGVDSSIDSSVPIELNEPQTPPNLSSKPTELYLQPSATSSAKNQIHPSGILSVKQEAKEVNQ